MGATRPPLLVNLFGLAAIRLPLAIFLAWPEIILPAGLGTVAGCGMGARGAWLAMAVDLTIRGLAMLVIFSRSGWTRVRACRAARRLGLAWPCGLTTLHSC